MNKRLFRAAFTFGLVVMVLALAGPAHADSVQTFLFDTMTTAGDMSIFSFTSGNHAGRATFTISGSDLIIGLTNTSLFDVMVPEENLTALFFDLAGGPVLSPVSAILGEGTVVYQGSTMITDIDGDGDVDAYDRDVGGEWAYKRNVPTLPAAYTISSVGLNDLIGKNDRFDTTRNLSGPASPDGLQYGILSTGDNPATGNGGILGSPMSRDTVVFTLTGLPENFGPKAISNVWFHYGTDYSPPSLPQTPIPEPITAVAFLMGAGVLGGYTSYNRKKK